MSEKYLILKGVNTRIYYKDGGEVESRVATVDPAGTQMWGQIYSDSANTIALFEALFNDEVLIVELDKFPTVAEARALLEEE